MTHVAVIYTDGQMSRKQIFDECGGNGFAPVFVYYKDSVPTLVTFPDQGRAHDFGVRNFDKKWPKACVTLGEFELEWINQQGWGIDQIIWPRKLVGNPNYKVGFEIMPLDTPSRQWYE